MTDRLPHDGSDEQLPHVAAFDAWGRRVRNIEIRAEYHNGHEVFEVSAPGYRRTRVVPDFRRRAELQMLINPETATATPPPWVRKYDEWPVRANIHARLYTTVVDAQRLSEWVDVTGKKTSAAVDRIWLPSSLAFYGLIKGSYEFGSVSGALGHKSPEGYHRRGSYKSDIVTTAGLQFTFHQKMTDKRKWLVEIDLDLSTGFKHVFEVIDNLATGGKTDQFLVVQLLAMDHVHAGYTVEPLLVAGRGLMSGRRSADGVSQEGDGGARGAAVASDSTPPERVIGEDVSHAMEKRMGLRG